MPEAAICNAYSPNDTLSPHRDVSEEADVELVSISIGCDALFLISMAKEDDVSMMAEPEHDNFKPQPPHSLGQAQNVIMSKVSKLAGKQASNVPTTCQPSYYSTNTLI